MLAPTLRKLLLYPKNSILCGFSNSELDDSLSWDLDFLLRRDGRFLRPFPESRFLTIREAMREETDMLKIVAAGRGKFGETGKGKGWKPRSVRLGDE